MEFQSTLDDIRFNQAIERLKPYEDLRKQLDDAHSISISKINDIESDILNDFTDEQLFEIWSRIRRNELKLIRF